VKRTLCAAFLSLSLLSPLAAGQTPRTARLGPGLLRTVRRAPRAARLKVITIWQEPVGRDTPLPGLGPCMGCVCAASVSPAEIDGLASHPGLVTAELAGRYRMRLDEAGRLAGLIDARGKTGLSGRGVLVAVIDTGLDWSHPDFLDDDGTRVAWLLDQTLPRRGVHAELERMGNGAVFSANELQAALDAGNGATLAAGKDEIGHGTHVTGIAASDDALYTGAAPGADIIAVKAIESDLSGFGEDRILAALAFADEAARMDGRPLVINLSLGNQMGAHDGTEPIEQALSALAARPGRAVVVAAGNEAGRNFHVQGAVDDPQHPVIFGLHVPDSGSALPFSPPRIILDFWHSGSGELMTQVVTPTGYPTEPVGATGPIGVEESTPDGIVQVDCLPAPHPLNGDLRTQVELSGAAGQALAGGTWKIIFSGHAQRIDGWVGESSLGGGVLWPAFTNHLDHTDLVGPPATARGVVAVGAYVSRTDWTDVNNRERSLNGVPGELAYFSSPGPTRDGRIKPEVVAPGFVLAATLSRDCDPRKPNSIFYSAGSERFVLADRMHALSGGTSMAAPIVAGALALAMEHDPELSGRQLKDLLSGTGRIDEFTAFGMLFDPAWGFGKLDADTMLAAAREWSQGPLDAVQSLCGVSQPWLPYVPDATVMAVAIPRDKAGIPLGPGHEVDIRALGTTFAGPVEDRGYGIYTRTLEASGARGGQAQISCHLGPTRFASRPVLRLAATWQEWGGSGVSGGGCTTTSAAACSPIWATLASLLLIVLMRRRSASLSSPCSSRRCSRHTQIHRQMT